MTNNLEDFEQPDSGQGGLPPGQGTKAKLLHAWRTKPLLKLLVVMGAAAALIVVGISLFSGGQPNDVTRLVQPPRGLHEAPGGAASPYFIDQTKKAENARETAALNSGGSALPTPLGNSNAIDELNANQKPKRDPLVELRTQIQQQKQQIDQMKQQQEQAPQQVAKPPEPFDNTLAAAMQGQMKQLMTAWEPKGIKAVNGTTPKEDEKALHKVSAGDSTSAEQAALAAASTKVIVPAGTVSYAQLLTEANSDVPGPILCQIVSGPLSGARAVGGFKVMNNLLILKFTLANLKGKDYRIDTLALDPDTTLGGMATEVDERYFTRVLLPAAAGFMQGFGTALSQGSSSVVTNGTTTIVQQSGQGLEQGMFQGLAQAGQSVGQFFQNQANQTKPLVRVAAGTPMGLFFVSTVTDASSRPIIFPYGQQNQPQAGYPGYGYGQTNQGQPGASTAAGYYPPGYGGQSGYGSPTDSSNGGGNIYNPNLPPIQSPRATPVYTSPYGGGAPTYGNPYYGSPTP